MKTPLVSIIVPNYNHAPFLKQRLETVYNQTFQDFEVLLLDDTSTDHSVDVLKQYKNHPKTSQFVINKNNSGSPFKQWQKGIKLAKGDFIWIAESDDYCELTFLEKIVGYVQENPLVGLSYCQTIDVNEVGVKILNRIDYTKEFEPNIWKSDFVLQGPEFVSKYLIKKNIIPNASAVLFKRALVREKYFSEELVTMKMCGDWFFWIQLSLQTEVGFLAEKLNYFRNHKAVSRNHSNLKIKKRRLLEESIIRYNLNETDINCIIAEQKLYRQWFNLHKISSVFSTSFYKMRVSNTSKINRVIKFVKFKLTK